MIAGGERVTSMARGLWLLGATVGVALAACSGDQQDSERFGSTAQALTSEHQRVLGFESVGGGSGDWTSTSGTISQSPQHAEGSGSLAISNSGNTTITSAALSSLGQLADKITLDLSLPTVQPNPWWMGTLKLVIECPSQQLWWEGLAEHQLQGSPTGQFLRFEFPLSATTRQKLSTGSYSDLRFKILLNVESGAGPWLLDRLWVVEPGGTGGGSGGTSGGAGASGGSAGQGGSSAPSGDNAEILGFENPARWTPSAGSLAASDFHVEGVSAVEVSGIGYAEITSEPLSTLNSVGSVVGFDLAVPNPQGEVWWWGSAAISVDCPSRGVYGRWLGQQQLDGSTLGRFRRVEVNLPDDVRAALSTGTYGDLRVKIILTVPQGSGPYTLDRFTFAPQQPEPAPPAPSLATTKTVGFETLESWKSNAATLSLSSTAVEGSSSLAVSNFTYAEITSQRLSSLGAQVGSPLAVKLRMPPPPDQYWAGTIALSLDLPSKGIYSQWIGRYDLQGRAPDTWHQLAFDLPAPTVEALRGNYNDLRIKLILNRPSQAEPVLLDELTLANFTPASTILAEDYVIPLPKGMSFSNVAVGQALVKPSLVEASDALAFSGGPISTLTPLAQLANVVAPRMGRTGGDASVTVGEWNGDVSAFLDVLGGPIVGTARAGRNVVASATKSSSSFNLQSFEAGRIHVEYPADMAALENVQVVNAFRDVAPGDYGFVNAIATFDHIAGVRLRSGVYHMRGLGAGFFAGITVDNEQGPVIIHVKESLGFHGWARTAPNKHNVLVTFAGTEVELGNFDATLVAPRVSKIVSGTRVGGSSSAPGSLFARSVELTDTEEREFHAFVRDDCASFANNGCGVFGCNTTDADADGLYDCEEATGGWADPGIFNGVRARATSACAPQASDACAAIDTRAKVAACLQTNPAILEQAVYAGWSLGPNALQGIGCQDEMDFWPPWSACTEAETVSYHYEGVIRFDQDGRHCFALPATSGVCGSLFLDEAEEGLTSDSGIECFERTAGVHKIAWSFDTALPDSASRVAVKYCFGGDTDCQPSAPIPQRLLRAEFQEGGACAVDADCLNGQLCGSEGTCGGTGQIGDPCTDGSCSPDLQCGVDNGVAFDHSNGRFCWAIGCELGLPDTWCGTLDSPCGKCRGTILQPTCEPSCSGKVCGDNSDDGCGGTCVLCAEREGECHADGECTPGLVCGQGAGPRFGLSGVQNACWRPICQALDPTSVPCGTVSSTCGLCPACQPNCQGKDYGDDGCGGSCGECAPNEWEGPNFECFGALGIKSTPPDGVTPGDYATQAAGTIGGGFEVTPRGQAQYTVPLVLPPGRAGMQPTLALSYNSAGGNGDLGQGWSLSGLQVITRCLETVSQDGRARGVRDSAHTDDDPYAERYQSSALCLDGARLMAIPGAGQQLEYRTEIDMGVKVVALDADNLDDGFLAYYPNGRVATFAHPDSHPDTAPVRNIWVATRVEDRTGNYLTIEHDARAYGSLREFAILRPKKIWYAGHADGTAPDTLVEFHYERRPDITNGYRDGVLFLNDEILKTVRITLGEMPMREYRFEHTVLRPGGPSMLTRLDECVPAFEGDTDFVCKPGTHFEYENDTPGLTDAIPIGFHPNNPESAAFDVIPDMPLDMNGDGVDDLLMVVLDSPPSTGDPNGWDRHVEVLMSGRELINTEAGGNNLLIPTNVYNAPEIFNVIDYDLDGRDDLLMERPTEEGNYSVLTFKDSGFEVVDLGVKSSVERHAFQTSYRSYVLDVDGDGVRDIIKCSGAERQKKTDYDHGPWTWTLVHLPDLTERPIDFNGFCFAHYIAADLAGSGRQSLLMQTWAYLGGSSELTRKEEYLAVSFEDAEYGKEGTVRTAVEPTFIPVSLKQSALALDANGDGITDLLNYFGSGYLETCLGTGRNDNFIFDCHPAHNHFNGEDPANTPPLLRTESGLRYLLGPVMDVNGDGRDDVMIAAPGESTWRVLESSIVGTDDEYYLAFSGWRVRELPGAPPTTWTNGVLAGRGLAMDVNGDGIRDFVQKPTGGFAPANLAAYVRTAPVVPKLTGVVDGLGGRIEVEYGSTSLPVDPPDPGDPLASHFAEGAYGGVGSGSCDYSDGLHCRTPRRAVVLRHREFQGPANQPNFTREFVHNYSGARFGLNGRGDLGFNFHVVTEEARGHSVVSWLDNVTRDSASGAFPFLGREYMRTDVSPLEEAGISLLSRQVQFDYRINSKNPQILTPYAKVITETKGETRDGVDTVLGTVEHTVKIDEYGNQKSIRSNWSGGGRDEEEMVTTTFAYESRPEFIRDWLVNLPESRMVTSSGIFGESQTAGFFRTTAFDYYDNGLLERMTVAPAKPEFTLSTRFGRDDYGNVLTVDSCAGDTDCPDEQKRTSTAIYEARQVFPESTTDAEGYAKETEFHHGLGVVTKTTEHGKTGSTALTSYTVPDGFGRIRVLQQPDGRLARTTFQSVVGDGMRVVSSVDGGPTVTRRYDELGRELSEGANSLGGTEFTTYTTYDVSGSVATRSRAQDSFNVDNRVEYDYDFQGRPTFTSEPGGAQSSNCYLGLVTCAIDADNNARCVERDHRGRVLFSADPIQIGEQACADVAEAFAATPTAARTGVAYKYGPFSSLEQAIRMPENTVVMKLRSDHLGRPESRFDVGSGTKTFTHTPFGELKTVTDSNATVTFEYDRLGRRRSRTVEPSSPGESTSTTEWNWREDLQQRLDFDTANGIETTVDYDDFGRVTHVTQNVDGEDFVTSIDEWDEHGRPHFVSYPGDAEFRVENVYDSASGVLKEVKAAPLDEQAARPSYWKVDELDEFGQMTSETFGNGLVTTRAYHEFTGLPDTIVTGLPGEDPVQNVAHTFHDSRNLKTLDDADGVSQSYTYDSFGRIDQVREGGDVVADFAYTPFGSLEVNAKGWTYGYTVSSPHSVDTVEDDNGNISSFQYNDDGTLSHRSAGSLPEINLEYTDFQKPRKVWETDEQAAATYDYDAAQTKVVKRTPEATTIYAGQLYYREQRSTTGDVVHHYLVGNGQSVVAEVVRTVASGGGAEQSRTLYLHADHLGSVQVVTDAAGLVVERRQFGVFGEGATTLDANAATKLGYAGHWQEPEHGLIDMGGRFYDPEVGQFLSSDPLIGSPLLSESFNLKAYVANNPLRFTDPSGFQMCDELSACGMGGASFSAPGGFEGMSNLHAANGPYQPSFSENKYTPSTNRGPKATTGERVLYGGLGVGVSLGVAAGATKLAVLCIGTGPACAAVLAGLGVGLVGYAVYDLFWDGGAIEIKEAFTHLETKQDAFIAASTLTGVGSLVRKPITNVVTRRLAGGAFLTTYEEAETLAVVNGGVGDDVATRSAAAVADLRGEEVTTLSGLGAVADGSRLTIVVHETDLAAVGVDNVAMAVTGSGTRFTFIELLSCSGACAGAASRLAGQTGLPVKAYLGPVTVLQEGWVGVPRVLYGPILLPAGQGSRIFLPVIP